MNNDPTWQYNEFKQTGKNYNAQTEVDIYDSSHADFRDIEAENLQILNALETKPSDRLLDVGSGTGTFAIHAAQCCARVYAVDVSEAMISYAKTKATQAGVSNIEFHHAGFLTYEHPTSPVDAIVTTFALHHLPDFWKGIALKRLHHMLKPNGRLYIHDVILADSNSLKNIAALIEQQATAGGEFLRQDAEEHFREEYSTYEWVMDGLLSRSGFIIKSKHLDNGVLGTYLCVRIDQYA